MHNALMPSISPEHTHQSRHYSTSFAVSAQLTLTDVSSLTKKAINCVPLARESSEEIQTGEDRQDLMNLKPIMYLYTDGACPGNKHVHVHACPAGWGVCIVRSPAMIVEEELFGPVPISIHSKFYLGAMVGSNNTAELTAIGEALRWLRDFGGVEKYPGRVCIRYDSEYAAKSVQGIYNGKKNVELIQHVRKFYKEVSLRRTGVHSLVWQHVKGHSNEKFNDRADLLATQGSKGEVCTTGHYSKSYPLLP